MICCCYYQVIHRWSMHFKRKNRTSCYTYFRISGTFNPDDISAILCLEPDCVWRAGDPIKDGRSIYEYSSWQYGRCDKYNVYVDQMMMQTISDLIPKIDLLNKIRTLYDDIYFSLEIVPSISSRDDTTPSLSPSREVIEFCYLTNTDIDIDLYVS